MIFTSAFCLVLALTYTSASTESKAETGTLVDKISEVIAGELVKVLDAAKGTKASMLDLNNKLLDATRNVLKGMEPELKALRSLGEDSADQVAKDLTIKINQNRALRNALPSGGMKAHRIIGPLEIGMNHILTDFIDIKYNKYIN